MTNKKPDEIGHLPHHVLSSSTDIQSEILGGGIAPDTPANNIQSIIHQIITNAIKKERSAIDRGAIARSIISSSINFIDVNRTSTINFRDK